MADTQTMSVEDLRNRATVSLSRLRGLSTEDLESIKSDVSALRDARQYDLMAKLAEAISRRDSTDARNRKLYAQCMIETGYCTVAIDVMRALTARISSGDGEWVEAQGLIGRAYKQIFFDARDKSSAEARDAVEQAIAAYRLPWDLDRGNTWHGVNLAALINCAVRLGIPTPAGLDHVAIARDVVAQCRRAPADRQDEWHAATLAEAHLCLGDLDAVEREIHKFAAGPDAKAFAVASTLRQFTEMWELDKKEDRERSIVGALRARLLDLDDHALTVDPREVKSIRRFSASADTLQAVLGEHGAETYKSMQLGLRRAMSVASIWLNKPNTLARWGTGFLVRAGDFSRFGRKDIKPDELLVLTNWHVVNEHALHPGIRPEDALVKFEAASKASSHRVSEIIWTRGVERHDAAFLRLAGEPPAVEPLGLAAHLPALHDKARVFIIGYPGGRELALSLQDNKLVSHEGPPDGKPLIEGVVRLHYRTPTEKGSSGSPVFSADGEWQVVALHHAGPPPGLNYADAVNEGISINSIKQAIVSDIGAAIDTSRKQPSKPKPAKSRARRPVRKQ